MKQFLSACAVLSCLALIAPGQEQGPPASCDEPLPLCSADCAPPGGDGFVDVNEILAVISTWGQDGTITGVRPQGDVGPGPQGDCLVDVNDLIAVISLWGICFDAGACCMRDGSCMLSNESFCADQGGTFAGGPSCFSTPECPNAQANDNCADGLVHHGSPIYWVNDFANTDGPPGTPGDGCESLIVRDLWYRYTANCAGLTNIRVNFSGGPDEIERAVAVYDGWSCPPGPLLGCAVGTGVQRVVIPLAQGQQFTIRVGTTANSPHGEGYLIRYCPN